MGNVIQAGLGQAPARQAAIFAGELCLFKAVIRSSFIAL